ncbi:MAG: hypothetical protein BM562_09940 [Alphaproteobacteria bacterium MedPE-SWcel]|nr:MAG: hypothetical protein BM562_09940 [Alphaproteobacteria bacterium MedPE-SWcel]
MSFIRPEASAAIWRWREMLAALVLLAIGLRWALMSVGIMQMTGWACIALAVVLAIVGGQRMRFRLGSGGPGVVQVTEGQISYFGPLTGGAVARSEIEILRLDHTARPSHWVLEQPGQPPLAIPVTATGAEALFDVFASLPGLKTERMLSELHHKGPHQVVIWQRSPDAHPAHWLH